MASEAEIEMAAMAMAYGEYTSMSRGGKSKAGYWEFFERNRARFLMDGRMFCNLIDEARRSPTVPPGFDETESGTLSTVKRRK